ncbi:MULTISPECIES: 6-phosphogluconolactonase [unclassified Proteiniphilum]|jgi:6-phosphogluconolactonase|uniref:6-phosphogluconolactonase n=1 Tax=unclassified Proteiniphilum TaxID=2622718 RepID=UPI00257E4CF7|nr:MULTISPECIES: 6-phosphogluconolactonase [unclassified Proteiniphilum]
MRKIRIYNTAEELNISFTGWLTDILAEKELATIALSGGSTPRSLFDYWARLPEGAIDWTKVKFFWGDERCVPHTDVESNYGMTKEHLFNFIHLADKNIFPVQGDNDPEAEAKRYGELLNRELESKNGIPVFDIMMLGMGDDGHTASIFPHEMKLWYSDENCVAATHPVSGQKRISLTGKVINASSNIAFLITGENKAQKVKEIIEQSENAEDKYPAALVQPDSGNLFWFLDNKAAARLTKGE